jgi:hypothetical protein
MANPSNFYDFISKVAEILMARQKNSHIRCNSLLTVYQSSFRKFHSTTTAVLKVTEDIRANLEELYTVKNDKNICIFIGFVCDFIDFLCEFTVKTTKHTVASYESSDFT